MLKLLDITKEYVVEKESTFALRGVSIEFRQNEFVSILGPSGCGKTTLLNIIGGLDRYTSGDIQIDGVSTKQYDDVDWDTYRNRKIGFVFQSYNLIPHMNIVKNVAMGLTLAGVEREERKERAMEALKKVGLEDQARKKPNQLSGGQMQRVAIARALVNNPDIILADEPTGALDSESGIQVMDLLKEVAEDRLVIMVTHNPMLAEEYSTRIVYLKDGQVDGDTMPYNSKDDDNDDKENFDIGSDGISSDSETGVSDGTIKGVAAVVDTSISQPSEERCKLKKSTSKLKEKLRKIRQLDKTAMKLSTAISLSWNNLFSKKGRTFLTSIAGSIGIIGIILVLSLSTGAKMYVNNLEESALSTYPLTVNKSTMDVMSMLDIFMSEGNASGGKVDDNVITTTEVLGKVFENIDSMTSENDLHAFKSYVDKNFKSSLASVKYNYGTSFNAYAWNPNNEGKDPSEQEYMKISPYSEMIFSVFDAMMGDSEMSGILGGLGAIDIFGQKMTITQLIEYMAGRIPTPWAEMSDNQDLLNNQYELLGKESRWPQKANEVVVVVREDNSFIDYQLFMLGLKSTDDVKAALRPGGSFASNSTFNLDEILGKEYKILTNADYLEKNVQEDGTWNEERDGWTMHPRKDLSASFVDKNAMKFVDDAGHVSDTVKVVGVVRPKPGVVASSISGVIGYTSELTKAMFSHAANHDAVKAMTYAYETAYNEGGGFYKSVVSFYTPDGAPIIERGQDIEILDQDEINGNDQHSSIMRELGVIDADYPMSIEFYCSSFEAKEEIVKFIEQYEKDTNTTIKYTDSLSTMMSFVNTMANTITGVLVAFAAISLVVSTIMIAIIIYTSVLERRKEIGVLRSIGARKKDISRVFIAESAILGGYSGVIGIIVSAIVSVIGSAILSTVFHIEGLMTIKWWHCLMMLLISVLLSMFAGFIPARIASKKDPAIALRSE